ncbi:MAG: hypothetical protein QOD38_802, partial [Acidimicrobiaceae bacterium]
MSSLRVGRWCVRTGRDPDGIIRRGMQEMLNNLKGVAET